MYTLLQRVILTEDFPQYSIEAGEAGTIVEVLTNPSEAYIVELVAEDGSSRIAYFVESNQLKAYE